MARKKAARTAVPEQPGDDGGEKALEAANRLSRVLAVLALRFAPSRPRTVGERASMLESLGFSNKESGAILGISADAVRASLSTARRATTRKRRGAD